MPNFAHVSNECFSPWIDSYGPKERCHVEKILDVFHEQQQDGISLSSPAVFVRHVFD
jgi:hypothetical protein